MRASVIIAKGAKGWEILASPDVPIQEQRNVFNSAGPQDKLMFFSEPKMSGAMRDDWRTPPIVAPPEPVKESPKRVTK